MTAGDGVLVRRVLRFEVPGEPRPQRRGRAVTRGRRKDGTGGHAAIIGNPRNVAPTQAIALFARDAMHEAGERYPLDGPLVVVIRAYRAKGRPTSKIGKTRAERDEIRPTTKPDADNYSKLALDALNGIAFVDDAQVVRLVIEKRYSERPRLEITIADWLPKVAP